MSGLGILLILVGIVGLVVDAILEQRTAQQAARS